jgi:hypothetical protein
MSLNRSRDHYLVILPRHGGTAMIYGPLRHPRGDPSPVTGQWLFGLRPLGGIFNGPTRFVLSNRSDGCQRGPRNLKLAPARWRAAEVYSSPRSFEDK